jgi:hypothetical protein
MSMNVTSNRMSALAGVSFVVLLLIADFIAGSQPKVSDSSAKITGFFSHHHKALLVGAVLSAIAAPLFVWTFATLARGMRRAGESALSVAAFGFVVVGAALAVASDAVYATVVQVAGAGNGSFVSGGYELSAFLVQKFFWFGAFLALAVWLGSKSMASSYRWLTLLVGVLFALAGIAVKQHGFFAVYGGMSFIGFLALLVWVLGTSVLLWKLPEETG